MSEKELTFQDLGRLGGKAKYKKYGKAGYSAMGKKGAAGKIAKYGPDYYKNIRAIGVARQLEKKQQAKKTLDKKDGGSILSTLFGLGKKG